MLNAILDYMTEHPERMLISADVIEESLIGFTLKDLDPFLLNRPTWVIKAQDFSKTLHKFPTEVRDILTSSIHTAIGRKLLAQSLTKGRNRPELEAAL